MNLRAYDPLEDAMDREKIGNFVLLEAGGKRVAVGAPQIRMIRLVTEHPDRLPKEIILEDGESIPLVFIEDAMQVLEGGKASSPAPAVSIDENAIAEIVSRLQSAMSDKDIPKFPSDIPRKEPLFDTSAVDESIRSIEQALKSLSEAIEDTAKSTNENWALLMTQLEVIRRNYELMLDERKKIQTTISQMKKL